jgi:tRNA G18 (ribose-2'-O)-methylase SpoU
VTSPGNREPEPVTIRGVHVIRIDSSDDERLSEFRNVPDPQLLRERGLFVAEGRLVVTRLLASGLDTRALLVTEAALASLESPLSDGTFPVYVVPQAVMNGVTGFDFHRGCLAIGVRPPARDWRDIVAGAMRRASSRLVVLERIGNVDNVGAIFRNAAAFGVGGVLLQEDCADPLYRKAIRTSMAASLTMPYAMVPWPDGLRELRETGWATVAMTPAVDAAALRDLAPTLRGLPVAIVLGHEGEGLTQDALDACTRHARIAMANGVDSINVATAAAIALYEVGSEEPITRVQG